MSYNPNSTGSAITLTGTTSGSVTISSAAVITTYNLIWPAAQGSASTVLTNDGAGNLTWGPGGSSGVSSINTESGAITITGTGGTTVTNIGTAFTINSATTGTTTVPNGGTGVTSFADLNQVIISGTTTTGPLQQVPGGTAGFVLTSNGTTAAPTWQATAPSNPYYVNTFTLSSTDITNQYVTLSSIPDTPADTVLTVIGGPMQSYGTDYTVSGSILGFTNGLAAGGGSALVSGDMLVVQYN
jgi:hypothetical protein